MRAGVVTCMSCFRKAPSVRDLAWQGCLLLPTPAILHSVGLGEGRGSRDVRLASILRQPDCQQPDKGERDEALFDLAACRCDQAIVGSVLLVMHVRVGGFEDCE